MMSVSDYNTNYIIYDHNMAFGYYYIASVLPPINSAIDGHQYDCGSFFKQLNQKPALTNLYSKYRYHSHSFECNWRQLYSLYLL